MLVSPLHTARIVETEKKNRWGATVKKPEVTEDFSKCIHAIDSTHQILHYHPCCRKTVKWSQKFLFFLLLMAAPKQFRIVKNNTPQTKITTVKTML